MTTAKAKRAALKTAIAAAMPSGWAVYSSPPETVTAPAVVIGPRSPYRQWGSFGTEDVNVQLTVLVPRALGADALDNVDDALDTVLGAIDTVANAMPMEVTTVGLSQAAGVDYVTAVLDVTVKG